ncbi:hypothetical protein IQ07DRAFT_635877 [Pyrenochaeta sp. DS3sAY3a]|nr:hypothetical protein IQ07DRAFT_635877 [Pyrenochaeta sp. DS3sAY3a]
MHHCGDVLGRGPKPFHTTTYLTSETKNASTATSLINEERFNDDEEHTNEDNFDEKIIRGPEDNELSDDGDVPATLSIDDSGVDYDSP